jgi:ribonucleoside-triphosphate reductase (formate)
LNITSKIKFINEYIAATNAATGSKYDSNANVTSKNICSLTGELYKRDTIELNRKMMSDKISDIFGQDLAKDYIRLIEDHTIYAHDESSLMPYCASISLYPLLTSGMKGLGGESKPPKHLSSFCGSFINTLFAVSSQFAGAIATVEFLSYFDYFARKDYGKGYLETHTDIINAHLQQVVYSINQPAAARNFQSIFWNISIYDQHYFESLLGNFVFPDSFEPCCWEGISKLQEYFLTWFNKERESAVLTFPVITAAMLIKDEKPVDEGFARMCAKQMSEGCGFFVYQSESADSLASCCRLRSEFTDNTFSYSLGAGGIATGSTNVITINMNRVMQKGVDLLELTQKVQKFQVAHRKIIESLQAGGLLPVYDAGYISLSKQFLTIGVNGMVEAAEFAGLKPNNNKEYLDFVSSKLKIIFDANKVAKNTYGYMFNTEFVPAESLGVNNARWDRQDGLEVNRDCYNSYFYAVEDNSITHIDKFKLHGKAATEFLDGGSALHLNLEELLTEENAYKLLCIAAKAGCNYFCVNVKVTVCRDCDHIDKQTKQSCSKCGSTDVDYATRIIGYLKKISDFSDKRLDEASKRYYHVNNI